MSPCSRALCYCCLTSCHRRRDRTGGRRNRSQPGTSAITTVGTVKSAPEVQNHAASTHNTTSATTRATRAGFGQYHGEAANATLSPHDEGPLGLCASRGMRSVSLSARLQDAELVALGIREDDPRLVALAYVHTRRTEIEQPVHLRITAVRAKVE